MVNSMPYYRNIFETFLFTVVCWLELVYSWNATLLIKINNKLKKKRNALLHKEFFQTWHFFPI